MISLRYRHNFLCESIHVHVQTLVYSFVHLHIERYIYTLPVGHSKDKGYQYINSHDPLSTDSQEEVNKGHCISESSGSYN